MKILFDTGVPRVLAKSLRPHQVTTTQKLGWQELENGDLLREAQGAFEVLMTTDSNIKYQQRLSEFKIALIVLRAVTNSKYDLMALMPQALEVLKTIKPGDCVYLYASEALARKDRRKGKRKS
jgi:predicted nuclease of predicted toxin-antitoxin system